MQERPFRKRVAVLGAGFGTRVTAPALRAEGWEIRALFSRRPERAQQIATKLEDLYGQIRRGKPASA